MKQFTLTLLGFFVLMMFVNSCKKDEADPQFEKTDLIGTWEQVSGADFVECPTGDNVLLQITETELRLGSTSGDDGCHDGNYQPFEYEFKNGNTFVISVFGFTTHYKVTSLSGNNLTVVVSFPDLPGASSTNKYQKKL